VVSFIHPDNDQAANVKLKPQTFLWASHDEFLGDAFLMTLAQEKTGSFPVS
jgi:hypothetical protein